MRINMYWQGDLTLYERACMASFVRQGFDVDVYSYAPLDLPPGVVNRDAGELLPGYVSTRYAQGGQKPSHSAFSNRFRYRLLSEIGGVWMDTDMLCLRPRQRYESLAGQARTRAVFAHQDSEKINGAFMMSPPAHPLVEALLRDVEGRGFEIGRWGTIGPRLITEYVGQYREWVEILPSEAFYPIHFRTYYKPFLPAYRNECMTLCRRSYALHLWNQMLQGARFPKDRLPPEGSFLHEKIVELLGEVAPPMSPQLVQRLVEGQLPRKKREAAKHGLPPQLSNAANTRGFSNA